MMRMGFIGLVLLTLTASCASDRATTANKKTASADANADVPCTEESCPTIPMGIAAAPLQGTSLVAAIGNPSNWVINGIVRGGGQRDIRMRAYNPPPNGSFLGQDTLSIKVDFSPNDTVVAQAPIDVVIRDVSRCKLSLMLNGQANQVCDNMNQRGLEAFEGRASIQWQVVEGNIEQFLDPTFTGNAPNYKGGQSGWSGCAGGFSQGALGGILGGNMMQGVLQGALGCANGTIGGLGR